MAITPEQKQAWLQRDNEYRVVLVVAKHSAGTVYFANYPYRSHADDSPAHQPFDEILSDIPTIESRIDSDFELGNIEFSNDGSLDVWLTYAWEGWSLDVYIGAPEWSLADFMIMPVSIGINGGIEEVSSTKLQFTLYDKRKLLAKPVQDVLLADGNPEPILLGRCFNISAVPIDTAPTELNHKIHDGPVQQIYATRDQGQSTTAINPNLTIGEFKLTSQNIGRITNDAHGETNGSTAEIVENLAIRGGFTATDIDTAALASYPNTALMGIYIVREQDAWPLIQDVAASSGGTPVIDHLGKLKLFRLEEPAGTPVCTIDVDEITRGGLLVDTIEKPRAITKLGYEKNWTVQDADSILSSVSTENRKLYSSPYKVVKQKTDTVKSDYPLPKSNDVIETYFYHEADAQAECNRRQALKDVRRYVFKIEGFSAPMALGVGDVVNLVHHRHGLQNGKLGIVIGLSKQVTSSRTTIWVWL